MSKRIRSLAAPGIRLQIMLWYTLVFALLLLIVGAVSYANVNSALDANLDSTLVLRAQQIAAGISDENGHLDIEDVSGALPGLAASATATPSISPTATTHSTATSTATAKSTATGTPTTTNHHGDDSGSGTENDDTRKALNPNVDTGILVRILDANGRPIYNSLAAKTLPMATNIVSQTLAGVPWYDTVTLAAGKQVRLYNLPLKQHGNVIALVQVGTSLASGGATLHSVLLGWLILAPIVLLLGALGSYWLASRAFIPVTRLIRMARQVEAGDLRQRVPVPRPHDELQELALTLNDMIARLDGAFARQRRFVADASHELRTPVSAIRSLTDVALLQQKSPAEYSAILGDINAETERLGRLISDLLALARADEGHTPLNPVPLRLDFIARDVAAVLSALAEEKGIRLMVKATGPVVVYADEDRLLQAILNLLNNALAYTPAYSGGVITVQVGAAHDEAVLAVSDTGIGIGAEHLPHIFQRFYRADPARASSSGSSGIGLAIADWVVRAHKGTISVESQEHVGSTFTIRLPLAARGNAMQLVTAR